MWPSASASSRRPGAIPRAVVDDLELDASPSRRRRATETRSAPEWRAALVSSSRATESSSSSSCAQRLGVELDRDLEAALPPGLAGDRAERLLEAALLERHRVQGHHRLAQAADRRLDDLVRALHLGAARRRLDQLLVGGQQGLQRVVVDQLGDPPPALVLGVHHLGDELAAGVELLAQVGELGAQGLVLGREVLDARPLSRASRAASPRRRRRRGRRRRASRRASAGGSSPSWSRGGSACRCRGPRGPAATSASTSCSRSVSFGGPPLRSRSWICCREARPGPRRRTRCRRAAIVDDRLADLLARGLLREVALGARGDRLVGELGLHEGREEEHLGAEALAAHRRQHLGAVELRHADVEHGDSGPRSRIRSSASRPSPASAITSRSGRSLIARTIPSR